MPYLLQILESILFSLLTNPQHELELDFYKNVCKWTTYEHFFSHEVLQLTPTIFDQNYEMRMFFYFFSFSSFFTKFNLICRPPFFMIHYFQLMLAILPVDTRQIQIDYFQRMSRVHFTLIQIDQQCWVRHWLTYFFLAEQCNVYYFFSVFEYIDAFITKTNFQSQ